MHFLSLLPLSINFLATCLFATRHLPAPRHVLFTPSQYVPMYVPVYVAPFVGRALFMSCCVYVPLCVCPPCICHSCTCFFIRMSPHLYVPSVSMSSPCVCLLRVYVRPCVSFCVYAPSVCILYVYVPSVCMLPLCICHLFVYVPSCVCPSVFVSLCVYAPSVCLIHVYWKGVEVGCERYGQSPKQETIGE